eukprot:Colp12_sorted_trinity150504_noHs@18016
MEPSIPEQHVQPAPIVFDASLLDMDSIPKLQPTRYANNAGGFVTGFDIYSKEEIEKKNARAQRFGAEAVGETKPTEPVKAAKTGKWNKSKGKTLELELQEERVDPTLESEYRPQAIHMYGTDELSTKDIMRYFGEYQPSFIEWINDSSCNVVWDDEFTAKRALRGMGTPLPPGSLMSEHPDVENIAVDNEEKVGCWWMKARAHELAPNLLIRLATKADVKKPGAAKRSLYYLTHGNPHATDMALFFDQGKKKKKKRKGKGRRGSRDQDMDDFEDDLPGPPVSAGLKARLGTTEYTGPEMEPKPDPGPVEPSEISVFARLEKRVPSQLVQRMNPDFDPESAPRGIFGRNVETPIKQEPGLSSGPQSVTTPVTVKR